MIDIDIIEGVAAAVHKALGVPIHIEHKENSMTFPCVYVKAIEPTLALHRGEMYENTIDLDVMYFNDDTERIDDTRAIIDKARILFDVLEYIDIKGRKIRGDKMKYRITDGVLHFFVTYSNIITLKGEREPNMKHLDVNERVKNG